MTRAADRLDTRTPPSTQSLLARVAASAVLIPLVIGAVYFGGRVFTAAIAFALVFMIYEWTRMVERREFSRSFYVLAAGGAAAMYLSSAGYFGYAYAACALAGVTVFFAARNASGLGIWPSFAAPYLIAPSIALIWLRADPEHGRAFAFILFSIVWSADIGAFIFGKLIGGPKISYALSPSKTWAGIGGGIVGGAVTGACVTVYLFGLSGAALYLLIGGALGAASVCGDLAESGFKRNFGLKDISGFIPGHGGVLDRLDGMIFATVAMTSGYFLYKVI